MRSGCTCTWVKLTLRHLLFIGRLNKSDRKHEAGTLKAQPHRHDSAKKKNLKKKGGWSDPEVFEIKNRNRPSHKHDDRNFLFGQTRFPLQKSPNSKSPIKTVFKE